MRASIKNLEHQMFYLETSVSRLEFQGKLPALTKNNLKHNVSVFTFICGKIHETQANRKMKKISSWLRKKKKRSQLKKKLKKVKNKKLQSKRSRSFENTSQCHHFLQDRDTQSANEKTRRLWIPYKRWR